MVTTYFKNLVADVVWHTSAGASLPSSYYLAVSSGEPMSDGTGVVEPNASSGYARVKMTGMNPAVDGATKNSTSISWPKVTVNAGEISYWAMFDAQAGGNLLMGGALDDLKHLDAGTTFTIDPNGLELKLVEVPGV